MKYLMVFGLCILSSTSLASSKVSLEELGNEPGKPFARIQIINTCTDGLYKREIPLETSKGEVILHIVENDNGCSKEPDTYEIYDLPSGVFADPYEIDLIEGPEASDGEPGYIYLYTWEGS